MFKFKFTTNFNKLQLDFFDNTSIDRVKFSPPLLRHERAKECSRTSHNRFTKIEMPGLQKDNQKINTHNYYIDTLIQ